MQAVDSMAKARETTPLGPDAAWAPCSRATGARRTLRLRGALHGDLLPAQLSVAPAPAAVTSPSSTVRRARAPRASGRAFAARRSRDRGHARDRRVRAHIDAHLDERLTLAELSGVAGLSPSHLQKAFKAALGLSPRDYVRLRRAERFSNPRFARAAASPTRSTRPATARAAGSARTRTRGWDDARRLQARRRRRDRPLLDGGVAARPAAGRLHRAGSVRGPARRVRHDTRSGAAEGLPARRGRSRRSRAQAHAGRDPGPSRRGRARGSTCRSTSPPPPSSGACGAAPADPVRRDAARTPRSRRRSGSPGPCGRGARLREQPRGARRAVPSRRPGRRVCRRLSLGSLAQAPARSAQEKGRTA